jgi:hypothetical protein
MGQLIVHQEENLLELSGFLLEEGDQVKILHRGSWISGIIAHDQQGWYFLTNENAASEREDIRLETGLTACLTNLS